MAILCGGRGTRLQERTRSIPKPMVEIGGRPILWHVIQIYLAQGFDRFLLLTGYRSEQIERFVAAETWPSGTAIRCLDTGLDTPTGGRVARAREALEGEDFCLTYADGVADVDLDALLAEHAAHGATVTMTVVQPELQFGVAKLDAENRISGFEEKPRSEHWINGGFLCCTGGLFDVLTDASRARARAAGASGRGRVAARLSSPGLLGLHGHLQGRRGPQRPVGERGGTVEAVELKGRTALVTGAYGLLGAWLTRALLREGVRVVTIRRDDAQNSALTLLGLTGEVDTVHGDIVTDGLVERAIGEYDVDTVFHLAAQTQVGTAHRSPLSTFEANIRGTWLLLEACRTHGCAAVVVASSDKAYGRQEQLPYTEAQALTPTFPYDVSKAAADLLTRSYFHTYGLPAAVTRFANLYGGGDTNRQRLIPETIAAVLEGRAPVIRSDGSPERDFLYVEDAAEAYLAVWRLLLAGRGGGEAFNGGGRRAAQRARGRGADLRAGRVPGSPPTSAATACPRARSTASGSTRASCASRPAGRPRWTCARAWAGRLTGTAITRGRWA